MGFYDYPAIPGWGLLLIFILVISPLMAPVIAGVAMGAARRHPGWVAYGLLVGAACEALFIWIFPRMVDSGVSGDWQKASSMALFGLLGVMLVLRTVAAKAFVLRSRSLASER